MKWQIHIIGGLLIISVFASGKKFEKCELAKDMKNKGLDGFKGYSLPNWVCTAFYESSFNTASTNFNPGDNSTDYGILQINSRWWCNDFKTPRSHNACNINCQEQAFPTPRDAPVTAPCIAISRDRNALLRPERVRSICKCFAWIRGPTEAAAWHWLLQIINEYVEENRSQYRPLRYPTGHSDPVRDYTIYNHPLLSITKPVTNPFTHIFPQTKHSHFVYQPLVRHGIKRFGKIEIYHVQ
ncbi:unnamed protein product [Ranitomeya imitator]|uniref:lysozyme n=1 Tax=Ranitomeya imitator TaxID=111125 RepID=A0ABN9MGJ2_9NEOB|nr:unnamed protein product [Ranitomeya imitator]